MFSKTHSLCLREVLMLQRIYASHSLGSRQLMLVAPADSRVPAHNMVALERRHFMYLGQMIAVSIIHGGPGPHCLSHSVVDYLSFGLSKIHADVSDVPDAEVKERLIQVSFYTVFVPSQHLFFVSDAVTR